MMTTLAVYAFLALLICGVLLGIGIVGYAVITFAAIVFDYFTPRR